MKGLKAHIICAKCGSNNIYFKYYDDDRVYMLSCKNCGELTGLDEWNAGRDNAKTIEEKEKYNVWDKFSDFTDVVSKVNTGEWIWARNSRCKYVELRIDMRSGHCIIRDRNGKRISPEELAKQV